jgi:hypothetical protein
MSVDRKIKDVGWVFGPLSINCFDDVTAIPRNIENTCLLQHVYFCLLCLLMSLVVMSTLSTCVDFVEVDKVDIVNKVNKVNKMDNTAK